MEAGPQRELAEYDSGGYVDIDTFSRSKLRYVDMEIANLILRLSQTGAFIANHERCRSIKGLLLDGNRVGRNLNATDGSVLCT